MTQNTTNTNANANAHIDTTGQPQPTPTTYKTLPEIQAELAQGRLAEERIALYLDRVESGQESDQAYAEACAYLTTQTEIDAETFFSLASRLGETAARRLAAYGYEGLANTFVKSLTRTKLAGQAVLQRFFQVLYWHFGGAVEGRSWEYNKDKAIVLVKRPKDSCAYIALRKDYDTAVLTKAGQTLRQYKGTVFAKEYKPEQTELVSPLVTLCKAAARLIDALEYTPKGDKPNKALQALQSATRADMERLGISETDFCQTIAKELVAYGKQLDKPTQEPADTVTRKADKAEDKADKAEDKAAK